MGWRLEGKPRTVRVTTRLAKEYAEMEAAHTDRPLSERRLGVYRKVLEAGGFRPVTWAKASCAETGQDYRVNGKHTSTLFSSVDLTKYQEVFVTVEEYACDSLGDVAKLYATFDSQAQTRTATDINRSFASVVPELSQLPSQFLNLLVGALAYHEHPTATRTQYRTSAAERAEALFDNVEFCLWIHGILADQKKSKHLRRVPVVAAMKGAYLKAKGAAEAFWTAVRDETGETPDKPDRKLARWLLTTQLKDKPAGVSLKSFRGEPREFFVKSIHAWNAWRKGETTDLKYYANAKVPAFA